MEFNLPKNQQELKQYSQELKQYSAELYQKLMIMQWSRILFHIFGVIVIFLVLLVIPEQAPYVLTIAFIICLLMELFRKYSAKFKQFFNTLLDPMLRDYEKNHITTAVLTLGGLTVISWLFPPFIIQAAALTMAFCDPASSVIGSLLKGRKIFIDYEYKSWSGAIACFLTAFLVMTVFFSLTDRWELIPWAVLLASGAATLGEINNRPRTIWNDNWMVPLFISIMIWSYINSVDIATTLFTK